MTTLQRCEVRGLVVGGGGLGWVAGCASAKKPRASAGCSLLLALAAALQACALQPQLKYLCEHHGFTPAYLEQRVKAVDKMYVVRRRDLKPPLDADKKLKRLLYIDEMEECLEEWPCMMDSMMWVDESSVYLALHPGTEVAHKGEPRQVVEEPWTFLHSEGPIIRYCICVNAVLGLVGFRLLTGTTGLHRDHEYKVCCRPTLSPAPLQPPLVGARVEHSAAGPPPASMVDAALQLSSPLFAITHVQPHKRHALLLCCRVLTPVDSLLLCRCGFVVALVSVLPAIHLHPHPPPRAVCCNGDSKIYSAVPAAQRPAFRQHWKPCRQCRKLPLCFLRCWRWLLVFVLGEAVTAVLPGGGGVGCLHRQQRYVAATGTPKAARLPAAPGCAVRGPSWV